MTTRSRTAKPTEKQIDRQQAELAQLIAEHRVVAVDMQSEHATCVALKDFPEYGISKGETFHLFASSYEGYAYIVNANGCGCLSYEHRHGTCKHSTQASTLTAARYFAHKGEQHAMVLEPMMRQDDEEVHVKDSIDSGEFDWIDAERAAWANATPEQRRAMYSSAFDLSYGDVA